MIFDNICDLEIVRRGSTVVVHIAKLPGPSKKNKVERPFKENHSASSAGVFKEAVLRGVFERYAPFSCQQQRALGRGNPTGKGEKREKRRLVG